MKTWLSIMIILAGIVTGHSQKIEIQENWWGTQFSQNGQNLEFSDLQEILTKNQEAFTLIGNARSNRTIDAVLSMAGSALIAFPLAEAIAGEDFKWTMAGVGAGFVGLSIPFTSITENFAARAIDTYNAGLPYSDDSQNIFRPKWDRRFSLGIRAGTNISQIRYNHPGLEAKQALGFHAGAIADLKLYKSLHLQAEAIYSREGAKDLSLTYINVPILLKWYYLSDIHLHVGPQLGFLLDAQENEDYSDSQTLSGVIGSGYESPGGILFDVRYSFSTDNILADTYYIPSGSGYNITGIQAWGQNFQLSLGYKF